MLYQRSRYKKTMPVPLRKQAGVVIIVALFIVALVATMAYVMMVRLEKDIERTALIQNDTQAEFYAQGALAWAMDQLKQNGDNQKPNQLVDAIPITMPLQVVHGYRIETTIQDMQGRFNLNNLSSPDGQNAFKLLLKAVAPALSPEEVNSLIQAIIDWIGPPTNMALTTYYAELPVPYRSAHRLMVSSSELQLVKGMSPALFLALSPYVTALPVPTVVNVQTADAPVLTTIAPTMTMDVAKAIQQLRSETPIVSTQAFQSLDVIKNHGITADKIAVTSNYFLVETKVTIENQQLLLYTLLERSTNDNKSVIMILWQSKGVMS